MYKTWKRLGISWTSTSSFSSFHPARVIPGSQAQPATASGSVPTGGSTLSGAGLLNLYTPCLFYHRRSASSELRKRH